MAHSLVVPQMGESITEGIISKLLVKDGTVVTADTPVFELDTDKISTEVAAGAAGAVKFKVQEGDTVPVGSILKLISEMPNCASSAAIARSHPSTIDSPPPNT